MVEEIRNYITKDLIHPSTFFDSVKSTFGDKYIYERDSQNNLILKGSRLEPIWTLYMKDKRISAICQNPILMIDDDADEFYNTLHEIIYF